MATIQIIIDKIKYRIDFSNKIYSIMVNNHGPYRVKFQDNSIIKDNCFDIELLGKTIIRRLKLKLLE